MVLVKIIALYVPALIGWWFTLVILAGLAINFMCRKSPRFAIWYNKKNKRRKEKNGNQ